MKVVADALLFDNDGVLVDSHEQVVAGWTQLAAEFDLDIETLLEQLVGVRAVDTLGRHLPPSEVEAAVAVLERLEVGLAAQTRPLRGAIELATQLHSGEWTIVTSASRRLAEARWNGAGIPIPARTVTADDVTEGKPHPEPFLAGAACLGAAPERCVVFEDSAAGGTAARAAGMQVIAVGHQPWSFEPLARVDDLTSVGVVLTADGMALELHPST